MPDTSVAEKNLTPYGPNSSVVYADPGYQADKKARYPVDSEAHARAAWSYVNQKKNAAKYTSSQLKRIKSRIKAALGKFGISVSSESALGWCFDAPYQVTEAVAEFYGDSSRAGSWSVSASNGPVSLNMSSWSMDPADLGLILRAAADAAAKALAALDPDMDGDVDVPGAGDNSDTDGDGGHETAPEDGITVTETEPASAGDAGPAPAGTTESEGSAMPENTATTTEAGAGAPAGLPLETIQRTAAQAAAAAVTAAFGARDAAKAKAKKERKEAAAREAAEAAARKSALTEALAELGIKIPATGTAPPAPATESTGDGTAPITEADVERRVKEALTEFTQGLHASGALLPARAGLVVREHAIPDADNAPTGEQLRAMSDDDLMSLMGGAMAQQADIIRPVGVPS